MRYPCSMRALAALAVCLLLTGAEGDASFAGGLLLLAVAVPVLYLSGVAHELGHALMGRWCGLRVTSCGMGIGRPLWVRQWRDTRFYLARTNPFQGLTFMLSESLLATRRQWLLSMGGGALANALLALLTLGLDLALPWWGWHLICFVNALVGLLSLLPFSFRAGSVVLRSDGGLMLEVLRQGSLLAPAPQRVPIVALRGLWAAVGDEAALHAHLVSAAEAWVSLGNPDEARALCDEAEAVADTLSPGLRAASALVRGTTERDVGNLERASLAFDEADHLFTENGDDLGRLVVASERAHLLLRQGDAASAVARLHPLEESPLLARRPALRGDLRALRRIAQAALPNAELPTLEAEQDADRRRRPWAERDGPVYRVLATAAAGRGDIELAARAYRQALSSVRWLGELFTDKEDRGRYRAGQASLLANAADFFRAQGWEKEAEDVAGILLPPDEKQVKAQAAQRRRNLNWHLLGCALAVVDIVVGVCFLWLALPGPDAQMSLEQALPRCTIFFSAASLALTYSFVAWSLSLFWATARVWGGWVAPLLGLLPLALGWLALLAP